MSLRLLIGPIALSLAAATLASPLGASAGTTERVAPDRGAKSTWTEADKTGFGTARARRSNVWFTLQDGRVSEVFYPDLSTPSVRSLELVVTDGRDVHRPRVRGHRRGYDASRRAQPALPAGRHRDVRPLPDHQELRHRSAPRRAGRPGAARVARRRQLPGVRRPRPGARQLRHGRPRPRDPERAGRHGREGPVAAALVSRRASAGAAPGCSAATTAGPTSRTTSALTRDGVRRARATSCRPDGSRA